MDAATLHKLNLIEVLEEEFREASLDCLHSAPSCLPDEAAEEWSENQIRAHFQSALRGETQARGQVPIPIDVKAKGAEEVATKIQGRALCATFPEPPAEEFQKWFPAYPRFRVAPGCNVKLRVVCLPCAGGAEDMFTSEGTGTRRVPSPLLDWCRRNGAEVLAAQLPGRGMRRMEACCGSAQDVAQAVLPLLAPKLQDGTPYVVISHSMGCWIAFELLLRLRQAGMQLPLSWFLSAMPCPSIPLEQRPWRLQHQLTDSEFQVECRGWDINDAAFQVWSVYEPLLRADFHIFDSYRMQDSPKPFDNLPIHAFWGTADRRINESMVQGWRAFTTGPFQCTPIAGNHLWPLQKESKQEWQQQITHRISKLVT